MRNPTNDEEQEIARSPMSELTWKDCIGKKVLYRQKGGGAIYGETVRGVTPNGFVKVSAWGDSWIDPKDYELLEVLDEG